MLKIKKNEELAQTTEKGFVIPPGEKSPAGIANDKAYEAAQKIFSGYGECLVFRNESDGTKNPVTRDLFNEVYAIFNKYAPGQIVNRGSANIQQQCEHRLETIQKKVKQIDPNLGVAFIPRTLYELVFIRKGIEEELREDMRTESHYIRLEAISNGNQRDSR